MSRLGKRPVEIPKGAEVRVEASRLVVKGPKGEVAIPMRNVVAAKLEGTTLVLEPQDGSIETRALWGTYASLVRGAIEGVTKGYEKKLAIEGVGYRMEVKGQKIVLAIGFSHPVEIDIPQGVTVVSEKGNMTISGFDKQVVGQLAATVRSQKKPEPYKGKGIRYDGEIIRRKQGKRGV